MIEQNRQPFPLFSEPPQFRRPCPPLRPVGGRAAPADRNRRAASGHKAAQSARMAEIFGVARVTARQAVQLLVMEGLLTAPPDGASMWRANCPPGPMKICAPPGRPWSSAHRRPAWSCSTRADVDNCPLLAAWELPSAPAYHYMRRVHIKDGVRFAYIELYLDRIIYDQAPERFNATTVIPVMDELRVNVSKARQELTIGGASPEVAQHLGVPAARPWPWCGAMPATTRAKPFTPPW